MKQQPSVEHWVNYWEQYTKNHAKFMNAIPRNIDPAQDNRPPASRLEFLRDEVLKIAKRAIGLSVNRSARSSEEHDALVSEKTEIIRKELTSAKTKGELIVAVRASITFIEQLDFVTANFQESYRRQIEAWLTRIENTSYGEPGSNVVIGIFGR
jgi:hypothetical protein